MPHPIVTAAEAIAEDLLFPTALDTDAATLVPRTHLDRLAAAGLYGIAGPAHDGGLALDLPAICDVVERLASACLATTFVWVQHHTPVRELTATQNHDLREDLLPQLCSGERRAGIALGGLQSGSAGLRAGPVDGGWHLNGSAPYVTGWGLIDTVMAAALTQDGRVLRALFDAHASSTLTAEPLQLIATTASGTVRLHFKEHFVPNDCVTSLQPYNPPPPYEAGGRQNGSLALGVARRCLQLTGPGPLDAELQARRNQLDNASEGTMAQARAAAAEFAVRAAANLIVSTGSRSILRDAHAQRLYREAAFLLVFGSRPAIRHSLLNILSSPPR